jgi:hypothetical protein
MRDFVLGRTTRAVFAASILLSGAGCAGGGQPASGPIPMSGALAPAAVRPPEIAPPASIGRIEDSGVKSKTENVSASGGKLKLPGLPSLKGTFGYTANDADSGTTVALSASLTNAFNAPVPASADIVYFLQAELNSKKQLLIKFDSGTEKAKISGSLLDSSKTYTLYVFVPAISSQPVDTIAAGSPNSKHQLEFDSPFQGASLPANTVADLELGQN